MMPGTIARYVQTRYAKPAYAVESFDVRGWPGLAMVVDALQRTGHEVDYCSAATAHRHRVVLVSVTSACDWWSFIAERERWQPCPDTVVVVGGPGVLNVRPFLRWADVFVFGRGEHLISPLADALLAGERFDHESVCYADAFGPESTYRIAQASEPWPHSVRLEGGKLWSERSIGCQRKCLFCGYTWHRRNVAGMQDASSAGSAMWGNVSAERTFFDLDLARPDTWAKGTTRLILGLDGFSERLRRMVNKPITREMVRMLVSGIASTDRTHWVQLYNISGLPSETHDDWLEIKEDIAAADCAAPRPDGKQWKILLHSTQFRAMPATPSACWPMELKSHRGEIAAVLRDPENPNLVFHQGPRTWAVETAGTEALPSVVLDAVSLRGTEEDSESVGRIARTRRFWGSRSDSKMATLAGCFDLQRLFGEFAAETLPTRYLKGYAGVERMWGRRPWAGPGALP